MASISTVQRYLQNASSLLGSRKKSTSSEVKFCSDRCKRHKLRPVDRQIEATFTALLNGQEVVSLEVNDIEANKPALAKEKKQGKGKKLKGDPRILVLCSEVEELVFGSHDDPEKKFGRKKNRARRGVPDGDVWKSVDMEGSDTDPGSTSSHGGESIKEASDVEEGPDGGVPLRVRPPQSKSEVNGSIGGEKGWAERIDETPEMLLKRREGQKRADQREMVRCAARRAVVFGLRSQSVEDETGGSRGEKTNAGADQIRLCEAVMNGQVVEPSYAKGEHWAIRWRAD